MTFEIRLIGGPFDGDEGSIRTLPGVLWAWQCAGPRCNAVGDCRHDPLDVHWTHLSQDEYDQARRLGLVSYRRDQLTPGGWWRFVYAEGLAAPLRQAELQKLLRTGKEVPA